MLQGDVLGSCYVLEERLGKSPYAETWAAVTNEACVTAAGWLAGGGKDTVPGRHAGMEGLRPFRKGNSCPEGHAPSGGAEVHRFLPV
jgi:hypothetical protein